MADAVAKVDLDIEAHFRRAADAMDSGASALVAGDIDNTASYMSQAVNEATQAVDSIAATMYC